MEDHGKHQTITGLTLYIRCPKCGAYSWQNIYKFDGKEEYLQCLECKEVYNVFDFGLKPGTPRQLAWF